MSEYPRGSNLASPDPRTLDSKQNGNGVRTRAKHSGGWDRTVSVLPRERVSWSVPFVPISRSPYSSSHSLEGGPGQESRDMVQGFPHFFPLALSASEFLRVVGVAKHLQSGSEGPPILCSCPILHHLSLGPSSCGLSPRIPSSGLTASPCWGVKGPEKQKCRGRRGTVAEATLLGQEVFNLTKPLTGLGSTSLCPPSRPGSPVILTTQHPSKGLLFLFLFYRGRNGTSGRFSNLPWVEESEGREMGSKTG